MSPAIPGRCLRCLRTIEDPGFAHIESGSGTMASNYAQCPHCDGPVQILEGDMQIEAGGIRMLAGPQWSWELVDELKLTLRTVIDERPQNPAEVVGAVSPEVAAQIDASVEAALERRAAAEPRKKQRGSRSLEEKSLRTARAALWVAAAQMLLNALNSHYSNFSSLEAAIRVALDYVAQSGLPGIG